MLCKTIILVNVVTDGVNGTSDMKFSSPPASRRSTVNSDISLRRLATTEPPDQSNPHKQ